MSRFLIAVGVGIVAAAGQAGAQPHLTPPDSLASRFFDAKEGLSLEQAVAQAREREPALRASKTDVEVAQGARVQAGLRPNPTLTLERRHEPGGTDRQTMVSVQVPLDLFRRGGRTAVADRELERVRFEVADRERLLVSEVREWYGNVLVAIRDLEVSDRVITSFRQEHSLLSARVDEGGSPPLVRDLVEVELRRAEAERLLVAARAEAAVLELKRLLGSAPEEKLKVSETLEGVVSRDRANPIAARPKQEIGHLKAALAYDLEAVVAGRPDVQQAAAGMRVGDARLERARRDGRFDVALFGGYTRMDAGFPQLGLAGDGRLERVRGQFNYVAAGAMVTVPIRHRNQGEVAAAAAMREGAAARYEAVRLAAVADIAAAVARDGYARQAVAIFTDGARALARHNLDVVRQSYALGRGTAVDIVSEQRRYLETERLYTEALREAYQARTALNQAMGGMQ